MGPSLLALNIELQALVTGLDAYYELLEMYSESATSLELISILLKIF